MNTGWNNWRPAASNWDWSTSRGQQGYGYIGYKGEYGEPPAWSGWSFRRQSPS